MERGLGAAIFSVATMSCAPRYAPPPTLPSSVTQISTAQEAQQWLDTVLTYQRDPILHGKKDFWAPCALTYALRKGDCEDYAICAAALLENDIDEGYIIYISHPDRESAHAVFAYNMNGYWGINSNDRDQYRAPQFLSLHEAVRDSLSKNYSEYVIYSYQGVDLINGNQDLETKMKALGRYSLK